MAIAFRSVGARTKVDTGVTGTSPTVAMPAGHVSNDLLLMVVLDDDTTGPTTPAGWTRLTQTSSGTSSSSPYRVYTRFSLFYRIDNGALGSSVTVSFSSAAWPVGKPYVLAWIAAYSGCDTTTPIGEWNTAATNSTTAAQAHPALSTALVNCWLITLRSTGSDTSKTFTDSVGTDVERVDDSLSFDQPQSGAMYDSNTALGTGAQTVRTTTASAVVEFGSVMISVVIRPAPVAGGAVAIADVASGTGTAFGAASSTVQGPWDLCGASGIPAYSMKIDWDQDGTFDDVGENVTSDEIDDIVITYGRNQERQLSPGAVGSASARLCNVSRTYSPEYASGPLFGDLDPARDAKFEVVWAGTTFPLFRGKIDDYDVKADFEDRTVSFSFLDGLNLLQGVKLSTAVYESLRTGDIIDTILDLAGWTAARDIDLGATIVKYWWAEGTDALTAIQDLVKSEGPPAISYVSPDGTFIFRDRHHRIQNSSSLTSQGTFVAEAFDCSSPPLTGFSIAKPWIYQHGLRDIVNTVSFDVSERTASSSLEDVWQSDDVYVLSIGQSVSIDVSGSDPFKDAVTPVVGTDFTASGAGTVNVTMDRGSGQSVKITLLAVGGSVVISALKLRGRLIPVMRTVKVEKTDSGSVTSHGEKSYPDTAPWANANDASAIADMILLHYAHRRPTIQLRVVTSDPAHFLQVLNRTISDRIHVTNDEMGIDDDYFVERVTHTIQRINQAGHAPVHSVILGCERTLNLTVNPFRFDVRGSGFDDGVFDPISADDSDTVFIFDHPTQGMFDTGLFGT